MKTENTSAIPQVSRATSKRPPPSRPSSSPVSFSPSVSLYSLPSTLARSASLRACIHPPLPESVQHTAMVPPQLRPHLSLLLFDRANPSLNPLSFSSPLGERFPQTWSAPSGSFLSLTLSLPFSLFPVFSPSLFCFPFDPRIYLSFYSLLRSSALRGGWPTGWLFA